MNHYSLISFKNTLYGKKKKEDLKNNRFCNHLRNQIRREGKKQSEKSIKYICKQSKIVQKKGAKYVSQKLTKKGQKSTQKKEGMVETEQQRNLYID